jgi:hypothetical protein
MIETERTARNHLLNYALQIAQAVTNVEDRLRANSRQQIILLKVASSARNVCSLLIILDEKNEANDLVSQKSELSKKVPTYCTKEPLFRSFCFFKRNLAALHLLRQRRGNPLFATNPPSALHITVNLRVCSVD